MYIYLDSADMPDDLYRHLFLSFIKRPSTSTAVGGDLSLVGGRPNGDLAGPGTSTTAAGTHDSPSRLHGLAEKLHGLTEKLHSLGGSVELSGRRSRAGRLNASVFDLLVTAGKVVPYIRLASVGLGTDPDVDFVINPAV